MHFPGRDLKSYAEPVVPERLVVGDVYFSVQYHDQDLLAPVVEALVFLGNNLDPGPEGVGHYFQDAGSFLAGVRYESTDEEDAVIYRQREGQVKHIFEFDHALDELLKCSLRRAASPEVRYRSIEPGRPTKG
jgi:hypothetical protein